VYEFELRRLSKKRMPIFDLVPTTDFLTATVQLDARRTFQRCVRRKQKPSLLRLTTSSFHTSFGGQTWIGKYFLSDTGFQRYSSYMFLERFDKRLERLSLAARRSGPDQCGRAAGLRIAVFPLKVTPTVCTTSERTQDKHRQQHSLCWLPSKIM